MPLRTRIFIILSVIIAIVLAISIFLYISAKNKKAATTTTTPTSTTNNQTPGGSNIPSNLLNSNGQVDTTKVAVQQPTTQDIDQNASKQLAKIFIERFGSYSSDSNYQNIKDVQTLVTSNLWSSLKLMIGDNDSTQSYTGVTTKVVATTENSWSSSAAKYTLSTMRTTSKNGSSSTTNQDVEVSLTKVNGSWLVDGYTWK